MNNKDKMKAFLIECLYYVVKFVLRILWVYHLIRYWMSSTQLGFFVNRFVTFYFLNGIFTIILFLILPEGIIKSNPFLFILKTTTISIIVYYILLMFRKEYFKYITSMPWLWEPIEEGYRRANENLARIAKEKEELEEKIKNENEKDSQG